MLGRDARYTMVSTDRGRTLSTLAGALLLVACGTGAHTGGPTGAPLAPTAGAPTSTTPAATPTSRPTPTAVPAESQANGALPAGALGQLAFIRPVAQTGVEPDIWLATVWPSSGGAGFTVTTVQLTNDAGIEIALSWSPDGERLAFIRQDGTSRSLWSMRVDGSPPVRVAGSVDDSFVPSWSPNSRTLAFVDTGAEVSGVSVATADGRAIVRLTLDGLTEAPAWSPSDELIAFRKVFSGGLDDPSTSSVWLMRPDGSGQRALTSGEEAVIAPFAWSPDGSHIAFGRYSAFPPTDGVGVTLRAISLDGKSETELTDGTSRDDEPVWAPSGALLMFTRTIDTGSEQSTADLWVVGADGSGAHRLLDSITSDFRASWSPDGSLVACMAESGPAGGGVAIFAADGSGMTIVDEDASLPAWRPR